MTKFIFTSLLVLFIISCYDKHTSDYETIHSEKQSISSTSIIVVGTAQDAGSPQIGCKKDCCKDLFVTPNDTRLVTSLGLIDASNNKTYLFDASPDIARQMKSLTSYEANSSNEYVDGIFLTHAHIGHYAGLMYLGKESADTDSIPLFVMPRMKSFLTENGPWSQLVERGNVILNELQNEQPISLSDSIEITPFLVPHRDEYSETVGYRIKGPNKTALFIPDIDKWNRWESDIAREIKKVDYAFLDATFYSGKELNNRDISEIPHPFVVESIQKFESLEDSDREKIIFMHFNHTNPLLDKNSQEYKLTIENGYKIATLHDIYEL
ncbi:MAG: hypothetical protein Kapaf2KO_01730 [Candidatus Kapaibacteriales bacterium]